MSNAAEARRVIAFRARPDLTSAIEAAAREDLCSISDIARASVARDLRRRGLLADLLDKTERATHG
jgi:hypothetical protein